MQGLVGLGGRAGAGRLMKNMGRGAPGDARVPGLVGLQRSGWDGRAKGLTQAGHVLVAVGALQGS